MRATADAHQKDHGSPGDAAPADRALSVSAPPQAAVDAAAAPSAAWLHWPSGSQRLLRAELDLLRLGGLVDADSVVFHGLIPIPSQSPLSPPDLINTLIYRSPGAAGALDSPHIDVVLVHGFGAGLGFWYRNIRALGDRLPRGSRVIACDWLGMGRSSRPPFPKLDAVRAAADRTWEDWAVKKAIAFFVDSLDTWRRRVPGGLDRFILVGHSLGGYLATHYAHRFPQCIRKLILASPIGIPERDAGAPETLSVTGRMIPGWLAVLWRHHFTPQSVIRGLGPGVVSSFIHRRFPYLSDEEARCLGTYAFHITSQPPSGEYALGTILSPGAWARRPLGALLPALAMPVYFMFGAEDWIDHRHAIDCCRVLSSASVRPQIQNERVIQIPYAGHQLHMDNADAFNSVLLDLATA